MLLGPPAEPGLAGAAQASPVGTSLALPSDPAARSLCPAARCGRRSLTRTRDPGSDPADAPEALIPNPLGSSCGWSSWSPNLSLPKQPAPDPPARRAQVSWGAHNLAVGPGGGGLSLSWHGGQELLACHNAMRCTLRCAQGLPDHAGRPGVVQPPGDGCQARGPGEGGRQSRAVRGSCLCSAMQCGAARLSSARRGQGRGQGRAGQAHLHAPSVRSSRASGARGSAVAVSHNCCSGDGRRAAAELFIPHARPCCSRPTRQQLMGRAKRAPSLSLVQAVWQGCRPGGGTWRGGGVACARWR